MARRERTTGLPPPRPRRAVHATDRRIAGIPWNDRTRGLGIVGAAGLLLAIVLGVFAYQLYEQRIGRPNKTVLSVDGEDFSLRYYADRLGGFLKANKATSSNIQLLEEDLLNKLEREAVAVKLAKQKGIPLSDDDVLNFIASQFGVQRGASGSSFDTLYRAQLRAQAVGDGAFRRLKTAELAESKLLDEAQKGVGVNGEQYVLRTVVSDSQVSADAILKRLQGGEALGTVAQTASLDLESRQQDGLMKPQPIELLPASIQAAVKDKNIGDLLGPIHVVDTAKAVDHWWVFKIERKEPTDYTDAQKPLLAQARLDAQISEARSALRSQGKIQSDLSASDITWAEQNASVPKP